MFSCLLTRKRRSLINFRQTLLVFLSFLPRSRVPARVNIIDGNSKKIGSHDFEKRNVACSKRNLEECNNIYILEKILQVVLIVLVCSRRIFSDVCYPLRSFIRNLFLFFYTFHSVLKQLDFYFHLHHHHHHRLVEQIKVN